MCSMSLRHVHDSGVLLQTTASPMARLLVVGQGDTPTDALPQPTHLTVVSRHESRG